MGALGALETTVFAEQVMQPRLFRKEQGKARQNTAGSVKREPFTLKMPRRIGLHIVHGAKLQVSLCTDLQG
jgi:hypothetical protein